MESNKWQLIEIMQSIYEAPAYHLLLEGALFFWVLWLIFRKSYTPKTEHLSEKEKNELIKSWIPEPLVPEIDTNHYALNTKIVSGKIGKYVMLNKKECINLASHNYLGFSEDKDIEEVAIKTLRKYGCGSCGPRGFYGTMDIHLELEKKLAQFINVEETVLYSYGFSTVASAIPAYAKRGDVIFCDEMVNFAIQKGLSASRSRIIFFKHNDASSLHQVLEDYKLEELKNPKKAKVTRKFLIVEGLYINTGKICALEEILKLKNDYKLRIFIDESYSFGVLGKSGKGIKEHFNIDSLEIDNITASLENAIGAYGGFSAGTSFIVDHQRLSGLGYCFSASLPPLQAAAVVCALEKMSSSTERVQALRRNAVAAHKMLANCSYLQLEGDLISPIKHLRCITQETDYDQQVKMLEDVVDYCYERKIALTIARYLEEWEICKIKPSIRLAINSMLTEQELTIYIEKIMDAFKYVNNFENKKTK